MSADLKGYRWARSKVGKSGADVYRLYDKPGSPDLFLKHGGGAAADDLVDEMVRLRWLAGRAPVPATKQLIGTPGEAWLLTTALPGSTAYQRLAADPDGRAEIVDALAMFLRRLHAIPTAQCPFDSGSAYRLGIARARIDAGIVDEDDFDEEREGWTAEQVWNTLQRLPPFAPDLVVTHGDLSLDNLLMVGREVIGCIDVGRVGIADRYQDLAIMWNCLGEFEPALQDRFLTQYGISVPDRHKLEFHLLLDELF